MDEALEFLLDLALWLPRWIWQELLDALAALVEAFPVPAWLAQWDSAVLAVSADVWWVAELFALQEGFGIVAGAYLIRFLIRRLPVVG